MDFFEHQEQARRKTGLLVFYFILAVVGIIVAVYLLSAVILTVLEGGPNAFHLHSIWRPEIFLYAAVGTSLIVFLTSAYKTAQLSGGGVVVARELGGREVDLNTTDFHERRLLNVVEEMAIASGVPVPTVFVMDREDSINAFAAGKTTSDAVIGVTRGCMSLLTRDELQGVVAHEFSHILNGDMRLNIRLMALLYGILFLALMGELILRFGVRGGLQSSRREGAGAALVMLLAGVGLLAIGYIGSFFGNLIKASVSRQREYLADASAVQFTRNPEGIAGALIKIGGLSSGSEVTHPMARDCSHLFFSSGLRSQMLATHPPLKTRIGRLLPSWDGKFSGSTLPAITQKTDRDSTRQTNQAVSMLDSNEATVSLRETEVIESMRTLHPEQVELGQNVHRSLPEHWIDTCHSHHGAQAMVYALLLAQDETLRNSELSQLRQSCETETYDLVAGLFSEVGKLHSTIKFSLVDLAIPTLRHLSQNGYQQFRAITDQLIASDRQVNLFEFALLKVIQRHLDTFFNRSRPPRMKYRNISRLNDETSVLISTLAAMSHPNDPAGIESAFNRAGNYLKSTSRAKITFRDAAECGLKEIDAALAKFDSATPPVKRLLLEAASQSVLEDNVISSREAELIRATADAIGCPIPPFVKAAPIV
ncbi:MAG: M48 family metallopeptidase [Verrucomicrobiales bacterium]|nr:M48 family metallopeptidase [Verrucomicrobiales bacterium]